MLHVTILQTTDDPRVVDKTFTTVAASLECKPTEGCTVLNPRIILSYTSNISLANYMYILEFGRFYYIENVSVQPGKIAIISGSVDVLRTYSAAIKRCKGTILRSESVGAPTMYPDDKLPIIPGRKVITSSALPNTLHTVGIMKDQYVLVIRAGATLSQRNKREEGEENGSE